MKNDHPFGYHGALSWEPDFSRSHREPAPSWHGKHKCKQDPVLGRLRFKPEPSTASGSGSSLGTASDRKWCEIVTLRRMQFHPARVVTASDLFSRDNRVPGPVC
ncbi:transcription factor IIIB 90 kDa subunit (TFIIIB90) [Anopheles sinensis]|uniref:Transcription factor IIIB 90 kDa subunit (TFIIIB90) n=1 Tax=Anopheles sinensis TaxID=74873 RepID=A0A084WHK1_ANOSI|nr:transcription factor IIIB 90 kDa subunit (TFIIIB90) [Anopheles sinensis]